MPRSLIDVKSALVHIIAWCHQATSHCLGQCWPRYMSTYEVTRPKWGTKNKIYLDFLSVQITEMVQVIQILFRGTQGPMYSTYINIMTVGDLVMQGSMYIMRWTPGPQFNIKMTSYQCRKSHCGYKTILWLSYLHNGISYSGEMTSLYRIRVLMNLSNIDQYITTRKYNKAQSVEMIYDLCVVVQCLKTAWLSAQIH